MNNEIFEDVNTDQDKEVTKEMKGLNNNKKPIIIVSIVAILLIVIIAVCIFISGKDTNKNKDNNIVNKESVSIAGVDYVIFDTTELLLDVSNLTTSDLLNISKLENLEKLDIKNVMLDDISFIGDLKKLNVIKINVNTKVVDFSVLNTLDNLFTLEIYGGIGKSANMDVFSKLDKLSTLYLSFSTDRDVSFISEMSNLSLLSVDCSLDLYNKIATLLENTKVRLETHGELSKADLSEESVIEDGIINWSQYDFDSTEVLSIKITSEYSDIKLLQEELNKISNYTNLKSLSLSVEDLSEPLSVDNFDFLEGLSKLESLNIDYLNANDINSIGKLVGLKTLVLSNGNMANSKFNFLSSLTKLETLNLSMQNITDITFLAKLTNLTNLYLSGNNISSIESLKKLTKLKELHIGCNNNLTNYSSLSSLISLETLMITPDTIDISVFDKLTNLKNLYVGISFDKFDDFKKKYPDINIVMVSECV